MMEDVFWKRIDQWGADGLALLRTTDPSAAARINKDRLATFVMSFLFRNPNMVKYFNAWAKERVLNGCLKEDYAKHRRPHEPASFEEFKVALEQRGMTELAAQGLRYQVENKSIREEILKMDWQVVTVPATSDPLLTSDVPIIINGALKDDDSCLILPLSTNEFFVAYNLGKIDMKKAISESVPTCPACENTACGKWSAGTHRVFLVSQGPKAGSNVSRTHCGHSFFDLSIVVRAHPALVRAVFRHTALCVCPDLEQVSALIAAVQRRAAGLALSKLQLHGCE
jgi:Protein of unknown function (DUF4238)